MSESNKEDVKVKKLRIDDKILQLTDVRRKVFKIISKMWAEESMPKPGRVEATLATFKKKSLVECKITLFNIVYNVL